ncbi:MAG: ergothioneine biosynthesis protein EgtB [Actinomycetota bacterium]|nr:ergothioneine biosynthesis protein EgtB [Actinomycetota bacterium]
MPDRKERPVFIAANDRSRDLKQDLVGKLTEARERTRWLLSTVSGEDLGRQHDPIMSPLIWDYGHIGNYEELWLLNRAFGRGLSDRNLFDIYDASLTPRSERPSLAMLDRASADRHLDAVREAVLEALQEADLDGEDPLLKSGFIYYMVIQHEYQHNETMLQTLQLMQGEGYRPQAPVELPCGNPPSAEEEEEMVFVPGGPFVMGTDERAWALDNERGAHEVEVLGFYLDTTPVTNRAYLAFVEDGGYERRELWDPEGWAWIREEGISTPKHWYQKEPHDWWTQRFGFDEPVSMDAPVVHVSWYEADAYARWAGKRLPTEAEWEKAASWDPERETKRLYPWGDEPPTPGGAKRANLDQLAFSVAEVGAYPAGASAYGVLGMIGDVWEWTASEFFSYPGFGSFPYPEYSEVFFGPDHKVLRGGSWATRPGAIRNTFRNWDFPVRRQLFAGFRCAQDG